MINKNSKIFVAGHNGLVGSNIVKELQNQGYNNIITKTKEQIDLTSQIEVKHFIKDNKPEYIFFASAKCGGIKANSDYPVEFLYENMMMEFNVIYNAHKFGVKKLLFLGSSCIYPKDCIQPIKEGSLLSGYLEPTNQPYSLAKISGIELCQAYNREYNTNFISVMPCNTYGIGEKFDLNNSHLIPALIMKFHNAKINNSEYVELWGTGEAKREFIYIEDLAKSCVFLMNNYDKSEIINIGTGKDYSIKEIANIMKNIVGFNGEIRFNSTKPNGMMRRLLNIDKITDLGYKAEIELQDGIKLLYDWYLQNQK